MPIEYTVVGMASGVALGVAMGGVEEYMLVLFGSEHLSFSSVSFRCARTSQIILWDTDIMDCV